MSLVEIPELGKKSPVGVEALVFLFRCESRKMLFLDKILSEVEKLIYFKRNRKDMFRA